MFHMNNSGVQIKFYWPDRVRQLIYKLKGYCGREHSMYGGHYCVLRKKHKSYCSCA